jgi:ABC-type lipoprotein export system ATPase subunit
MQRVAIARAVIHRPPLILADEPTGNLDSKNGEMILDLIRAIHKASRPTIIMATHSERAAKYGDYVVTVADGRVNRGWVVGSRESEKQPAAAPTPDTRLPTPA